MKKLIEGYTRFREKYHLGGDSLMDRLANSGQHPETMVITCCDSRVDPAILFQCDPGDIFVARNVANIIPPYDKNNFHNSTSAALEYAVCYLNINHLVILAHSKCGGIDSLINGINLSQDEFISNWVSLSKTSNISLETDEQAKLSLHKSYASCLTFPWVKQNLNSNQLEIHRWFFDIQLAEIWRYCDAMNDFVKL